MSIKINQEIKLIIHCIDETGKERSIAFDCSHEEKINFEGFTENGCYGNQPQPFEV